MCAQAGGWQDQIAASFGGMNRITFGAEGYGVCPVIISAERKENLNQNLMLFFTGFTRFSADVQQQNLKSTGSKIQELQEMCSLVKEAEKVLTGQTVSLDEFGRLLDYTWNLKRHLSTGITTDSINELYKVGIKAGAQGGKLLGAGGGGFLLFYVRPEYQAAVKDALKGLIHIPFKFDNTGTKVIYYAQEG